MGRRQDPLWVGWFFFIFFQPHLASINTSWVV
jgi:hypothetical protein